MQNLVGIRIPDSAEYMRVSQRALQRMVLLAQRRSKGQQIDFERFDSSGAERTQPLLAVSDVKRGAMLRAGLGELQRAVVELEGGERFFSSLLIFRRFPVKPPCDHQMQHQPDFALETDRNPFSYSTHLVRRPAKCRIQWRCGRAQQK